MTKMNGALPIERFTPVMSAAILETINTENRKLRESDAEKFAEDMRAGRWTRCFAPIQFYDDKTLADGQHRLRAIVASGVAQEFPVVRGLHREEGLNIDTGRPRSLVDAAKISGADETLTNELVGVCRGIEDGSHASTRGKPRSNAQKMDMVQRHRAAAEWACANGPKGKMIRNGIVLAAIGRAWYYEADRDRLRRFSDVLGSGFYTGESETAAIALRTYLLGKGTVTHGLLWRDTFLKCQNAIKHFMQGNRLTVIKGVSDDAYPVKKRK
jgi:hypothetical protein